PLKPPVYPLPLHYLYVNHRLYNPFKLLNVIGWDACLDLPTPHSRLEAFRHEFNLKSFYLLPLDDRVSLKAHLHSKPSSSLSPSSSLPSSSLPSSLSSSLSSSSSRSSPASSNQREEEEEEKKKDDYCVSEKSRECMPSVSKENLSGGAHGDMHDKVNRDSSSSPTYEISFPIDRNLLSYLANSTSYDLRSSSLLHSSSSSSSPPSFSSTSEDKKEGNMNEREGGEEEREKLFFSYKTDLGSYILPDMDAVVVMRDGIIDPKLSVNLEKFGGVEGAEEEVEGAGFVERGARGSSMFDDEDEEKTEEKRRESGKEEEKTKTKGDRTDVSSEGRDGREGGCCGGRGGGESSHCGGTMPPRSNFSSSDHRDDKSAGCTYTGGQEGVQREEQEGERDGVFTLEEKEEEQEESAYHSSSSCSSSSCGGGGEDYSSHHHHGGGDGGGGEEEQEMNGEEEDAYVGSFMNIRHPEVRDAMSKELQFIPEYSNYWRTNTQPFHRGQIGKTSRKYDSDFPIYDYRKLDFGMAKFSALNLACMHDAACIVIGDDPNSADEEKEEKVNEDKKAQGAMMLEALSLGGKGGLAEEKGKKKKEKEDKEDPQMNSRKDTEKDEEAKERDEEGEEKKKNDGEEEKEKKKLTKEKEKKVRERVGESREANSEMEKSGRERGDEETKKRRRRRGRREEEEEGEEEEQEEEDREMSGQEKKELSGSLEGDFEIKEKNEEKEGVFTLESLLETVNEEDEEEEKREKKKKNKKKQGIPRKTMKVQVIHIATSDIVDLLPALHAIQWKNEQEKKDVLRSLKQKEEEEEKSNIKEARENEEKGQEKGEMPKDSSSSSMSSSPSSSPSSSLSSSPSVVFLSSLKEEMLKPPAHPFTNPRVVLHVGRDVNCTFYQTFVHLESLLQNPQDRDLLKKALERQELSRPPYMRRRGRGGFVNSNTRIVLEKGAEVHHIYDQEQSDDSWHMENLSVAMAPNSTYVLRHVDLGSQASRVNLQIEGEESSRHHSFGLSILHGIQEHSKYEMFHHLKPHAETTQVMKSLIANNARSVWRGRIRIERDGIGASAESLNRVILLDEGSKCIAVPTLEIIPDDVIKANHGAMIRDLDVEPLFFLMARGIDELVARKLLMKAYADDVVKPIRDVNLEERVYRKILSMAPKKRKKLQRHHMFKGGEHA
ncbi:sufb sufd domain-containing protein, partial [Cystoisospora suis]